VNNINKEVGDKIDTILQEEQDYYLRADRDKLKTPPFVYVRRIERPGIVENQK